MKTKKVVGLLLAMVMLISLACPIFAEGAVTVKADKASYDFGEMVTITTNKDVRIEITNSNNEKIVWGATDPTPVDGSFVYSFRIPKENEVGSKWKTGVYTVSAGNNEEKVTTTIEVKKTPVVDDISCKIKFSNTSFSIKKYVSVVDIYSGSEAFRALDKVDVDFIVKNSRGSELDMGDDYKVKFRDHTYSDTITDTGKRIEDNNFYFNFTTKGTYNIEVIVSVDGKEIARYDRDVTLKAESTGGTGSGSTGSTGGSGVIINPGNTGNTGGIVVQLSDSQFSESGVPSKNVTYTANMISTDSFNLSIKVDGQVMDSYVGYDPVMVQVPYSANTANTQNLVVVDASGAVVPRSLYVNGKMFANLKVINGPYTIKEVSKSFDDVTHPWATQAIGALSARNVINGVGENLYDPDRAVTRAEFIKMIVTMFDVYDASAKSTFVDLDTTSWYSSYIGTAQDLAITNGYEDGSFKPNDIVSRQEMSAMLFRAAEVLSVKMNTSTAEVKYADDDSIQSYAKASVYRMQQAGVLKGIGENNFDPAGTCTRAQAAVAIYNMFTLSMNK